MIYSEKTHCPESHPFVYDYRYEDDSCCSTELDSNNWCSGVQIYCDAVPCQNHPSVAEGGSEKAPEKGQLIVEGKK